MEIREIKSFHEKECNDINFHNEKEMNQLRNIHEKAISDHKDAYAFELNSKLRELDDKKCREFEFQLGNIKSQLKSVEADTNNIKDEKKNIELLLSKERDSYKFLKNEHDNTLHNNKTLSDKIETITNEVNK